MAPKFGTSGLRGLVVELTPDLVADHVRAFLRACDTGDTLCVGHDLRASSPGLADHVAGTAAGAGYRVVRVGAVPTPALALAAGARGAAAIMVTGSHIPEDRNGLKFYSRRGEITKADEAAILSVLDAAGQGAGPGSASAAQDTDETAGAAYIARYVSAFGPRALSGRRIAVYEHSAVGRDHLAAILKGLGAEILPYGRSDTFIPVDTEAVDSETRVDLRARAAEGGIDAIVSTDGDSDRPLLTDERGVVIAGDVMGQIAAETLGARIVVTPVSSNGGVLSKGFDRVVRTRIGSPYVIAAMEEVDGNVAGYEANGGFLLGFEAQGPAGSIPPLMTRDAVLPVLATLLAAGTDPLSTRIAAEPPVVTAADRLQDVPEKAMRAFVTALADDPAARAAFLSDLDLSEDEDRLDLTDGVRMALREGGIVHVRPSGNAPELRLYVEAGDLETARSRLAAGLGALGDRISGRA